MKYLMKVELRFEVEANSEAGARKVVNEEMRVLSEEGTLSDHYVYEWTDAVPYEDGVPFGWAVAETSTPQ